MLCRIEYRRDNILHVVHLAGRLTAAHVPDFLDACAQPDQTVVELDELVSADAVGLEALLLVEQQGARLISLPEYLRFKLESLARERGK